jgi:hypothetical protein
MARKLFAALYENEPRVTVHESELPYYAIEWRQPARLPPRALAQERTATLPVRGAVPRSLWGRCPKVYIHTGHRHHKEEKDHTGARVTQHPTLASRDAYAARGGWWSEREITAITYSKTAWAGAVNITPEMLAA